MIHIFNIVMQIIDEYGSVNLLTMHYPNDKYDGISDMISQILKSDLNSDIGNCIYNIFVQEFGISTFDKSFDECILLGNRIIKSKLIYIW